MGDVVDAIEPLTFALVMSAGPLILASIAIGWLARVAFFVLPQMDHALERDRERLRYHDERLRYRDDDRFDRCRRIANDGSTPNGGVSVMAGSVHVSTSLRPRATVVRVLRSTLSERMPCQGIARPGHAPIEWRTEGGRRACAASLNGAPRGVDGVGRG